MSKQTASITGSEIQLRPVELGNVLSFHEKLAEPIVVLGAPGIGKSEQVVQVSKAAGRKVIYFDTSSADPTDVGGIPFPFVDENGNRIVERAVFKKLVDNDPLTVFFDETFQGSPAVMNSVAPAFLEKRFGDIHMPKDTWIVGATNRPQDRAGTHRPPAHLPNRVTIVETGFHVDDLRSHWIDIDMPMELMGFAKFKPDAVFDFDANRLINATPRSWTWVGKHMDDIMQLSTTEALGVVAGRVTQGHAAEFLAFMKVFGKLPTVEEMLMNPDKVKIPEELDVKFAMCAALANAATKDNFDRIAIIEERLERNFGVMLVNDAQRRRPEIKQTKAFVQWAVKNANVLI